MITDRPPRKRSLNAEFAESDRLSTLELPPDDRLSRLGTPIEAAIRSGKPAAVRKTCAQFFDTAADFYSVNPPRLRVLAARPLRVRESGWATELYGDYDPEPAVIRVWMRTAVRKQVTSLGTFLSTLCHEFCHHLDLTRFGFSDSPHTRGFFARTAILYHHARGTPLKRLIWAPASGDRWRIDWPRTNRGN